MLPKPSGEILNHQSAFGYLWWLNGKESLIPAGITIPMEASLANAPEDLIAGMDKNGQYLDIQVGSSDYSDGGSSDGNVYSH